MKTEIRKCAAEDLHTLQKIGFDTYKETFEHQNTQETMEAYLQQAFNFQQLEKELSNVSSTFYLLYINDEPAGYLKVNVNEAQTENFGDGALEIERIYLKGKFQGQELGKYLLNKGMEIAKELNKNLVWLGVWEKNEGAINFYDKLGFKRNGAHSFYMGDEKQTDFIMTKTIKKK